MHSHSTSTHQATQPTFTAPQTVADVVRLYLASASARELDSFDSRRRVLLDFAAAYGALPLAEAKPWHCQQWLDSKATRWASNWTKRRAVAGVHRCFHWAVRLGVVAANPFKGITAPAGERGQPMTLEEYQGILRHSPPCFRRLVTALRYSGARPGELAKATLDMVDEANATITLHQHKTMKKTGRQRRIILNAALLKLVAWRRRQPWATNLLFPNSRGRRWSNPAICWRLKQVRLHGAIRPETTLYGARHFRLTEAIKAGVDIATVAALAGHTRITTTQTYLHCSDTDHLRAAVAKIDRRAA